MRYSNYAFWAGVSILALFIFGFYGLGYVPSKLFLYEDIPASIEQILVDSQLLRRGITASLIMNIASLFLGLFVGLWLRQYSKIAGNSAALLLWTGAFISLFKESNSLALIHCSEVGSLQEIAASLAGWIVVQEPNSRLENYPLLMLLFLSCHFLGVWLFFKISKSLKVR